MTAKNPDPRAALPACEGRGLLESCQLEAVAGWHLRPRSLAVACGMFLAAPQLAGLSTLTHTPSPMKFLGEVLERPAHERAFLLIPVGYAADDCQVPKKALLGKPIEDVTCESSLDQLRGSFRERDRDLQAVGVFWQLARQRIHQYRIASIPPP